jgi:hypothetical protein
VAIIQSYINEHFPRIAPKVIKTAPAPKSPIIREVRSISIAFHFSSLFLRIT